MTRFSLQLCISVLILGGGLLREARGGSCVLAIAAPKMPPLARQARLHGTTTVKVAIDIKGDGRGELAPKSSVPVVFRSVISNAVALSRFEKSCASQHKELVFEFRIEGKPMFGREDGQAIFEPPDRIVVVASPSAIQP